MEIAHGLEFVLQMKDVAVYIEAKHLCVASRGVEDTRAETVTSYFGGKFEKSENRETFYSFLK
jgi:GTP cyclohydrolase I